MKRKIIIIVLCAALAAVGVGFAVFSSAGERSQKTQTAAESAQLQALTGGENAQSTEKSSAKESALSKTEKSTTEKRTEAPAGERNEKTTEAQRQTEKTQPESVEITISVTCKNALRYESTTKEGEELELDLPQSGYIIESTRLTLESGATVFDALEAACRESGVPLGYQSKSYITQIGALKEKACTGASGWMYRVNGENPAKGASKYILENGDAVEWYYVTSSADR